MMLLISWTREVKKHPHLGYLDCFFCFTAQVGPSMYTQDPFVNLCVPFLTNSRCFPWGGEKIQVIKLSCSSFMHFLKSQVWHVVVYFLVCMCLFWNISLCFSKCVCPCIYISKVMNMFSFQNLF